MAARTIELFMWGYQDSFRVRLEVLAKNAFKQVGIKAEPTVLLVGLRRQGVIDAHPVCIEPEDDRWTLEIFKGLEEEVERHAANDPERLIFHSHPVVSDAQPERLFRKAVGEAVRNMLDVSEGDLGLRAFCSAAVPVERHYVVCAILVPEVGLATLKTIPHEWRQQSTDTNLALRTIDVLLAEARRSLHMPEPNGDDMRSARELVRAAADSFMRVSVIPGEWVMTDAFAMFDRLSQLAYEGARGTGRLLLTKKDDPRIDYQIRFAEPVSLQKHRWIRKLLEMSNAATPLIADYEHAFGLGAVTEGAAALSHIDFVDQHEWLFRQENATLLHCRFGEATLPRDAVDPERFEDTLNRLFPEMPAEALDRHRSAMLEMTQQPHGSMIVIAEDAEAEAQRLAKQGTRISPTPLTPSLLNRASRIDGTILASPDGTCHAIGVILDGPAHPDCTPARGARLNSGIRYVSAARVPRLALVMSDDRTLDVIPLLLPRMSRVAIEGAIEALEVSTLENFHKPRNRLDRLRFYLDQSQCDRINAALDRLDSLPHEPFELRFIGQRFAPDPGMNDSYLLD